MKKKIAIVLTAALLTFPVSTGVVRASTTTVTAADEVKKETPVVNAYGRIVKAGILSDSHFAWLDELFEEIELALTFDSTEKAKKIIEHASERLAEAVEISKKGDKEHVEKALNSYAETIVDAEDFLEDVKNMNTEDFLEYLKDNEGLTIVNQNNILVLQSLLEKLPLQAAQKVAMNIVRSIEKANEKVVKMEGKENSKLDNNGQSKKDTNSDNDEKINENMKLSKEARAEALEDFKASLGISKAEKDQEKAKLIQSTPASQTTELEEPGAKAKQTPPEQSKAGEKAEEKKSLLKQADISDDDHGNKDKDKVKDK